MAIFGFHLNCFLVIKARAPARKQRPTRTRRRTPPRRMTKKNTFLICLDGSKGSKECLCHLSRLLKPQDEVFLMTVVKANDKDDAKAKAGNILVNGQESLHKLFPDLKVEHYIETNVDPREAILKQAQNLAVDFIVVGSRGLSGLAKMRLGSVSEYVVRHSECPVIVARSK